MQELLACLELASHNTSVLLVKVKEVISLSNIAVQPSENHAVQLGLA